MAEPLPEPVRRQLDLYLDRVERGMMRRRLERGERQKLMRSLERRIVNRFRAGDDDSVAGFKAAVAALHQEDPAGVPAMRHGASWLPALGKLKEPGDWGAAVALAMPLAAWTIVATQYLLGQLVGWLIPGLCVVGALAGWFQRSRAAGRVGLVASIVSLPVFLARTLGWL